MTVLANLCLNTVFVFVFSWGASAIALATSLASWFQVSLLLRALPIDRSLWRRLALCSLSSALAAWVTLSLRVDASLDFLLGKDLPILAEAWTEQLLSFAQGASVFLGLALLGLGLQVFLQKRLACDQP